MKEKSMQLSTDKNTLEFRPAIEVDNFRLGTIYLPIPIKNLQYYRARENLKISQMGQ